MITKDNEKYKCILPQDELPKQVCFVKHFELNQKQEAKKNQYVTCKDVNWIIEGNLKRLEQKPGDL